MPTFGVHQISDAELALLSDYVYGLGGPGPTPTPSPAPAPTPTPGPGTPTPTPTPPALRDGATLFSTYCAGCHGATGQGTGIAPPNAGTAPSAVRARVRSGGGIMPAFSVGQISDAELALLSDYVYGLGGSGPTPTPSPAPAPTPTPGPGTPTPTPTPPALRDGATLFSTYCAGCHGATGQGTGIAPDIAGDSEGKLEGRVRKGDEDGMPAFGRALIGDIELHRLGSYVENLPKRP